MQTLFISKVKLSKSRDSNAMCLTEKLTLMLTGDSCMLHTEVGLASRLAVVPNNAFKLPLKLIFQCEHGETFLL